MESYTVGENGWDNMPKYKVRYAIANTTRNLAFPLIIRS